MLGPIPGGSERGDVDPGRTDPDRREAHRVQGENGDHKDFFIANNDKLMQDFVQSTQVSCVCFYR